MNSTIGLVLAMIGGWFTLAVLVVGSILLARRGLERVRRRRHHRRAV